MKQASRTFSSVLALLCVLNGHPTLGFSQASDAEPSGTVQRIMSAALLRCYSKRNEVKRISFVPPTNQEIAELKLLGPRAVAPLARYLDLERKNGFTQLFAVRFLAAIGGSSTLDPLKRAFAQDQWEVTRAAALHGMFDVSQLQAKPYVEAALKDGSAAVRQEAQHLWDLYQQQSK